MLRLRVLTWNLGPVTVGWQELGAVLSGWDWDVAVLAPLPGRWPLPLATALDAEFRYAPWGGGSGLRRMLSRGPLAWTGPTGGEVEAILARRDRIIAEWPVDARTVRRTGVHAARLACGIWIANLSDPGRAATGVDALRSATGRSPLVLAAPRSFVHPQSLTEVAHGGDDALWATGDLCPVSSVDVLAGGAVGGNPPLAVTLEHRPGAPQPPVGPGEPMP